MPFRGKLHWKVILLTVSTFSCSIYSSDLHLCSSLGNVVNNLVAKSSQYFANLLFLIFFHYNTFFWFSSYTSVSFNISFTCFSFSTFLNVEFVQGVSPGLLFFLIWKLSQRFIYCLYRKENMSCHDQFSEVQTWIFDCLWMYHGHWKYNISKTELLCPVDMLFLQSLSMILLSNSCSSQKTKNHSNNSLCLRLQPPISYQIDKILTTSIHFFPRNQVIIFFLILHIKVISPNPVGFTTYESQVTFFPSSLLSPNQFQPPLPTTPLASQWMVS